jgi:hypothetical protein
MADKSLDVLIRILTERVGSEKAEQIIKDVNAATRDGSRIEDEAAKKTAFLGERKAELKRQIRELGVEFPLAGQAARLFLNPLAAGISLAIGGFALMKRHLDDWNRAMDEAASRNAARDFLPGIDAATAALAEGARHAAGFRDALSQIGKGSPSVTDTLDKITSKIHELEASNANLIDSKLGLTLSQINLAQTQGKLTPAQADVARFNAQNESAQRQEANKRAAEAAVIGAQQQAFATASANQPKLVAGAQSAQSAFTAAEALLNRAKADLDTQTATQKDGATKGLTRASLVEAIGEAQAKYEKERSFNAHEDSGFGFRTATGRAKDNLDQLTQQLGEVDKRQALVDQLRNSIPRLEIEADRRKAAMDRAESAVSANAEFISTERTGIPDLISGTNRSQSSRAAVLQNERGTRANDVESELTKAINEDNNKQQVLLGKMLDSIKAGTGISKDVAYELEEVKRDQQELRRKLKNMELKRLADR